MLCRIFYDRQQNAICGTLTALPDRLPFPRGGSRVPHGVRVPQTPSLGSDAKCGAAVRSVWGRVTWGPSHAIGYAGPGHGGHLSRIRRLRGGRGESSSLDQAAEILDRSGADYTPGDPAVRGDHERAGEGADGNEPVKLSRDKVARVTQAWVEKPVLLHVGLRAGRVVLHVDTDELDARWLELPRSNRQGRCFLLADRTP
jgi:hypothetical protein